MFQNNPLLSQLKQQLHESTPRIEGVVRAHEKGYGFLDVDNKTSFFIPVQKMKRVFHGDRVSGTIESYNDNQVFEPETLLEASLTRFIAKVTFKDKMMFVIPDNMSTNMLIRCKVNVNVSERLKEGDAVVAQLISHPLDQGQSRFFAEITQFIAEAQSPFQLWLKTLIRYNLETTAPHSENLAIAPSEAENRQDLTALNFFTIDSENTQDMDDAIAIEQKDNGVCVLWIAIADPTAYILPDTHIDTLAKTRNFTTYLPDFTVPMLPKDLANELCSLRPNQKRPAMVCCVSIDSTGKMNNDMTFTLAWIESKAKLAYSNVSDFLEGKSELWITDNALTEQLMLLKDLTLIRLAWRKKYALTFKDNGDFRFIFNEERQVKSIIKDTRRIAHHMVEEVMIIANLALTSILTNKIGFGIFNVHQGFDPKSTDQILALLHYREIHDVEKLAIMSLDGYVRLRKRIDNDNYLSMKLRKFQVAADFSITPQPHFSLGFDAYATWTSPIRKYGDMINHRIIKSFIRGQTIIQPDKEQLILMNERRKMLRLAERDLSETLYAQYLVNKIGDVFIAEIIDINRGGARVRLTDIGAFTFMPLLMIHDKREQITTFPEEGCIKINDDLVMQVGDHIQVAISAVKNETKNILVKWIKN